MIDALNEVIWSEIESALTPHATKGGTDQIGVVNLIHAGILTPFAIATGTLSAIQASVVKTCSIAYHFFQPAAFSGKFEDVVNDSRHWAHYGDINAIAAELEKHPLGEGNPDFQYGTATCTYQDSGSVNCPDSQWAAWETQKIANPADRSGKSANLFGLYKTELGRKEITDRLHKLGVTTYRFSVEWSHLQPQKDGPIDMKNLKVYVDLCKHLRDEGIEPLVTLLHFSEPGWFHERSFEDEENSKYFVAFVDAIIDELIVPYKGKPLVDQFCTINEPGIEAFSRYVMGSFSASPAGPNSAATSTVGKVFELFSRYVLKKLTPGTVLDFNRAGNFLRGALLAHSEVYALIKKRNPDLQVGIVHQYLRFIPTCGLFHPIAKYFTQLINEATLHYFKTGEFRLKMPFCHIESTHPIPVTDFGAIQYYVRVPMASIFDEIMALMPEYIRSRVVSWGLSNERTLMPFHEDPEGLYTAVVDAFKHFNKPIWITENGISTHSDEQRRRYMTRALFAAKQAAEVIGRENLARYYNWCFVRNLEWNMGMNAQDFGAYELLPTGEIAKDPKKGMDTFIKIAQAFNYWKETQKENIA